MTIRAVNVVKYQALDGTLHDSQEDAEKYWKRKQRDIRFEGVKSFLINKALNNENFSRVLMNNTRVDVIATALAGVITDNWDEMKMWMKYDRNRKS